MHSATAKACANIALIKYWGKQDAESNSPATPSLSLSLDGLTTTTTVKRIDGDTRKILDTFLINDETVSDSVAKRLTAYLDLWRDRGLIEGRFSVESHNSFPTGAGLASSASGFAALAMALSALATKQLNRRQISRLARRGSGSAARSIPGGIAAMPATSDPGATCLIPAEEVPWGMVVAEVKSTPKSVGSTEGMNLSRDTSPYYSQWLATAKRDYQAMKIAIQERDFTAIGTLAEANSHAMHACMVATRPALIYWNDLTLRLLHEMTKWRSGGLETYATIDAGPHVCFFSKRADLDQLLDLVKRVEGVKVATLNLPGPAALITERS